MDRDKVLPLAQPNYGHLKTDRTGFTHWSSFTENGVMVLGFDPACPRCFMEAQQQADWEQVKKLVEAAISALDWITAIEHVKFPRDLETIPKLKEALAQLGVEVKG